MVPATLSPQPSGGSGAANTASPHGPVVTLPLRGRRLRPETEQLTAAGALVIPCFVAGPENQLVAKAIAQLLAGLTGSAPIANCAAASPLLLVGPSGCGKSHLSRGLAEAWHSQRPDQSVAYLTASDFCRQVSSAIADRSINDLRSQLRKPGLLVIDDLHRTAGEGFAVEELVHTIDALETLGGMLVATSTVPLSETPRLGRALIGRMLSGVCLNISPLGESARQELLRLSLESLDCTATPDALELLSEDAPTDPRRLFSLAINLRRKLRAGAVLNRPLAVELAESGVVKQSPPAREIIAIVAKYYGLPKSKMTSPSRQQTSVLARAVAIYLIRELTPLSYDQIGKLLGGRDHTTVIHNFRRIDRGILTDRALRDAVDELRNSIHTLCPT